MTMRSLDVTTRPARESDFEWLLALRLTTMSEHFEASGLSLPEQEHAHRLSQEYSAIEVVQMDGSDVGMVKVIRETDLWHLIQIQLLPEHQRKGIGTFIIEAFLVEASAQHRPVTLQVLKANPAKGLYERLGFSVVADLGHSYEMRFND